MNQRQGIYVSLATHKKFKELSKKEGRTYDRMLAVLIEEFARAQKK